jgi:hypothetical protein
MILKVQNSILHYERNELTYSGPYFKCWFTGYFFFESTYYFSVDACKLLENLFAKNQRSQIQKLNGIFECILIDEENKKILLVNDRFGFNQLFYWRTDYSALISDDFWEIQRSSGVTSLDKLGILEMIQYRYISGKYTIAANIFCLEPSSILEINYSKEKIKIAREEYWHLQYKPEKTSIHEAEEKIYHCLNSIIARYSDHLLHNKNIGINLTGGLDSRYIVALLINNGISPNHINAFTYGSPDSEDIRYSKAAAGVFGIRHTPLLFENNFEDFFSPDNIDNLLRELGFYSYYFPAYGVNKVLPYYKDMDYLLSGYDGFYMGLKATEELFNLKNKQELLNYIYTLNATILTADQSRSLLKISTPDMRKELISRIDENLDPSKDPVSSFFNWTLKSRNRKYLLGVYKMQNRNTTHLLTFYDYNFIDLMTSLPFEALNNQQPYINSMFRKVFRDQFEPLSKIPVDQRGTYIQVGTNYVLPKKRKYTFKKLIRKIFNSYDDEYNYPIRQQLKKKQVFSKIIGMIESGDSEFLDKNKVIRYILKYRKSEYFARYGLLVILSIIRLEKLFKKVNP